MIEREYYKLEEASKVVGCKISDLLHLGATGKIRLSVYVNYYDIYDVMRVGDESKRYGFHSYLGLPDELKPVHDNIYDLPKQNAIQLEHNGSTKVITVFCQNDTVVSSNLGLGERFYRIEDLLIVSAELNKAMAFVPPEFIEQAPRKMIDIKKRNYYSIEEAAKLLDCKASDIIHYGAIGELPIYALAADWIVEPRREGLEIPSKRLSHTGKVRITSVDLARYEADLNSTVKYVLLPTDNGVTWFGNLLRPHPIHPLDLQMASYASKPIRHMKLVIMDEDLQPILAETQPKEPEPSPNGSSNTLDTSIGLKERRSLLTIIAALCNKATIDPQARGAAGKIKKLVEETVGAQIDEGTIKKFLDQIPDALESRMK